MDVDHYRTRVQGYNVTNVYDCTNFFFTKVWRGVTGGAISMTLYANGWYIWTNLPAEVNGVRARYTVREEPVSGYMTLYSTITGETADDAEDGTTIVNEKIPGTGDKSPLLLWTLLMMASAAVLLVLKRRKA